MTLLLHVDESVDAAYHFHVGLVVAGAGAAEAEELLDEIVEHSAANGACRPGAELHAHEMVMQREGWVNATMEQVTVAFGRALQVLNQCSIEVLARGVDLRAFHQTYGESTDPYRWEFRNLLERFNERLEARGEFGLVIADDNHQHREQLQRDVVVSRRHGTGGYRDQRLLRIVDTAHFVESRLSRVTQLADLVAYVLRRRQSFPTERDQRAETAMHQFRQLVGAAIPHPTGQYLTIRS